MKKKSLLSETTFIARYVPLILTVVAFVAFSFLLFLEIRILNRFGKTDILLQIRWADVLVGITIYLKTSVDFAIFIGNLMSSYPGWKNRVAIEIGTAAGNTLGTIVVLAIWSIFREVDWILALMIFIAALVLFQLAEEGLAHTHGKGYRLPRWFYVFSNTLESILGSFNKVTHVFLKYIIPHVSMKAEKKKKNWSGLFLASFTIPFILGLDDFAGYVPVFNIVNVFGFSVGVLMGHMILNLFLFISPEKTISTVKHPVISLIGSIAFIGLALWGLFEIYKIFFGLH
ncbi:MAG: hypothetical protein Q7S61_00985 [bacterium]|nr:hypothetical protein [bacterium]